MPRLFLIGTCCIAIASAVGAAEPAPTKPLLHPLFSTGAVLQRDKPVTVWGWSAPGATVTVEISGPGLTPAPLSAAAGADGRWQAALPAQPAGMTGTLRVRSDGRTAQADDLIYGDVWLCGGQSNMEWRVGMMKDFPVEQKSSAFPRLRHLAVTKSNAGHPQELITGTWQASSPGTVGNFTAVGYFFGRKLHQDLDIPIGLVNSTWGGTHCEAWTSAEALATLPEYAKAATDFQDLVARVDAQTAATGKPFRTLMDEWYAAHDPGSATAPGWAAPDIDTTAWKTVTAPGALDGASGLSADYRGTLWLRREIQVPAAAVGKHAILMLPEIWDPDATWINGIRVGGQDRYRRIYHLDGKALRAGANTIAIRLLHATGRLHIPGPATGMSMSLTDAP